MKVNLSKMVSALMTMKISVLKDIASLTYKKSITLIEIQLAKSYKRVLFLSISMDLQTTLTRD
jgi:hypothetical protein